MCCFRMVSHGVCFQAVTDDLIDSIISSNIPVFTEEEKYNESVTSSINRIEAVLRGEAVRVVLHRTLFQLPTVHALVLCSLCKPSFFVLPVNPRSLFSLYTLVLCSLCKPSFFVLSVYPRSFSSLSPFSSTVVSHLFRTLEALSARRQHASAHTRPRTRQTGPALSQRQWW